MIAESGASRESATRFRSPLEISIYVAPRHGVSPHFWLFVPEYRSLPRVRRAERTAQSMGGDWPDRVPPVVATGPFGQLSAFLVGNNGQLYLYDQADSAAWGAAQSMGGNWP